MPCVGLQLTLRPQASLTAGRPLTSNCRFVGALGERAVRAPRTSLPPAGLANVHAYSSCEVPIEPHFAEGLRIEDYLRLPVSQYVLIDLPLGGQLRRLSEDVFELTVPQLTLFGVWVQPLIRCQVRRVEEGPSVDIKSVDWEIRGSQFVQDMDLRNRVAFDVHSYLTSIDPNGTGPGKSISSSAEINVRVDVPPPVSMLPTPFIESSAGAVLNASLSTLLRSFVQSLAEDYNKWAKDTAYRDARAKFVTDTANV